MRLPHLFAVEEGPEAFAALWSAAALAAIRLGWLELGEREPAPARLEAAAAMGALRAVRTGGGRVVSVKPIRGEAVLRDLLREHFRGCAGVLVRGSTLFPRLRSGAGGWVLEPASGASARTLSADELLALLRRPLPEI